MKKKLFRIFIGLFLFSGLILVAMWFLRFQIAGWILEEPGRQAMMTYIARSPEPEFEKHFVAFSDDEKLLSKNSLYSANSHGKADAGPFLNAQVGWSGAEESYGKLALPIEVTDLLKTSDWYSKAKIDWEQTKIDIDWMKKLHEFDHWSYDLHPPHFGPDADYVLVMSPLPNYSQLTQWAKIRLLKGRDDHDMKNAVRDVEQLARLIMSTDNLVAAMTATAIQGIVGIATGTTAAFAPAREAAKRYFFAQQVLTDIRLSNTAFEKGMKFQVGLCTRIGESILTHLMARRIVQPHFPAEFARFDKLVRDTESTCRPSYLRRAWADPNFQGMFKPGKDIFAEVSRMSLKGEGEEAHESAPELPFKVMTIEHLEAHPKVGSAVIFIVLGIAEPNWFRRYEEKP